MHIQKYTDAKIAYQLCHMHSLYIFAWRARLDWLTDVHYSDFSYSCGPHQGCVCVCDFVTHKVLYITQVSLAQFAAGSHAPNLSPLETWGR